MKCPECGDVVNFTVDKNMKPIFKCASTVCNYTRSLPGEVICGELGLSIPTESECGVN